MFTLYKVIKSAVIAVLLFVSAYTINLCLVSWAGPLNGIFVRVCQDLGIEGEAGMLLALINVSMVTLTIWVYGVPELIDTIRKAA